MPGKSFDTWTWIRFFYINANYKYSQTTNKDKGLVERVEHVNPSLVSSQFNIFRSNYSWTCFPTQYPCCTRHRDPHETRKFGVRICMTKHTILLQDKGRNKFILQNSFHYWARHIGFIPYVYIGCIIHGFSMRKL